MKEATKKEERKKKREREIVVHICVARVKHTWMVKTARMNESIATKNTRNGRDKFQVLKSMASGGRFINGVGLLEIKITVGVSPVRVHAVDHR